MILEVVKKGTDLKKDDGPALPCCLWIYSYFAI